MRRFLVLASLAVLIQSGPATADDQTRLPAEICPENAAQTSLAMLNTARKVDMTPAQVSGLSDTLDALGKACSANPFVQLHVAEAMYALARYASPTELVTRAAQSYTAILNYDAQLHVMRGLVANPQAQLIFNQQRSKERHVITAIFNLFLAPVMLDLARQGIDYDGFSFSPDEGCPYATADVFDAELKGQMAALNDFLMRSDKAIAVTILPNEKRLLDLQAACTGHERDVSLVLAEGYLNLAGRAAKLPDAKRVDGSAIPPEEVERLARSAAAHLDAYEAHLAEGQTDDEKRAAAIRAMRQGISDLLPVDDE